MTPRWCRKPLRAGASTRTRWAGASLSPPMAKALSISPSRRATDVKRLAAAILAFALTLALTSARADVVSERPDGVSVALYHGGTDSSLEYLSIWSSSYFGFVTETRVVDL